jgi:hypothetical protein
VIEDDLNGIEIEEEEEEEEVEVDVFEERSEWVDWSVDPC